MAASQVLCRVTLTELDADDARPVLRAFPTEVPPAVGFFKQSGLVTDGTAEEFAALAGRCAVFRLDPSYIQPTAGVVLTRIRQMAIWAYVRRPLLGIRRKI